MNKMNKSFLKIFLAAIVVLSIASCKKNNYVIDQEFIPPGFSKFLGPNDEGLLDVTASTTTFNIPVSVTDVSTTNRTVNFTVTSISGAQEGVHYTLSPVVIPAGQTITDLVVTADFSEYALGRKDTLLITIANSPDLKIADHNKEFTLFLRGPCNEANIVLDAFAGDYANTNEFWFGAYGPYDTEVTDLVSTGPTTATATINNIFDFGWNPIVVKLDWTDINNRTITLDEQSGIADGGTISASYAGEDVSVRAFPGENGTFSFCNETMTIKMQVGITGLGWFDPVYTVTLER